MVAKLTVIFFIILCLMVGVFLTLLPWVNFGGIVDWGDNYILKFDNAENRIAYSSNKLLFQVGFAARLRVWAF